MKNFRNRTMLAAQQFEPEGPLKISEIEIPELERDEVLVRIHATPVNPSDLAYLTGKYTRVATYPTTPGIEGSGTVMATGSSLLARRLSGKNVMCSAAGKGGTWAQFMVTKATKCIPLGAHISLDEGATLIVNPLTALIMVRMAQQKKAHAIINTAAASSLGKMLNRMCISNGVELINIVRKPEQASALKKLGATHVLNSGEPGFADQLKALAKQLNVKLAFDAVGGELTGILLQSILPGGEVISYGGLSNQSPVINTRELSLNDKKLGGLYLAHYMSKAGLFNALRLTAQVKKMVKNEVQTTVHQRFDLHGINEAITLYQSQMSAGKVLLYPNKEE